MSSTARASAGAFVTACLLFWGFALVSPEAARWALLKAGLAVLLLIAAWRCWRGWEGRLNASQGWALALLGWLAFSLLWSPDRLQGMHSLLQAAALTAAFLAAQYIPLRGPVTVAYGGAIALAFTTGSATSWAPWGGFGNENFVTEFLLIGAPLVLRPWRHLMWPAALGYLLFLNESRIEYFVLVVLAGVLLLRHGRRSRFDLALSMVVIAMMAAWVVWSGAFADSLRPRLELLVDTGWMALQHPLLGWGLGSFVYGYPHYQAVHLDLLPWLGTTLHTPVTHAGAAHNEYIQLWIEGGIVALFLGWKLLRSLRVPQGGEAYLWALAIAAIIGLIEFPVENPHTGLVIALAAGRMAA